MINNLINFEIFRENKALFDQIVVIFDQIVIIFDQIVVIHRPICEQIFLIKNEQFVKNYQYSVTIRIDLIQTISNYLRPNEYHCYIVFRHFQAQIQNCLKTFICKCHRLVAQCYKTFYGCNLHMLIISKSVGPQKSFSGQSNVCGSDQGSVS